MPIYSHPPDEEHDGVHLAAHLRDVRDRVSRFVEEDAETPTGESVTDVVEALALVHDIGKATTWFQQYIDPDRGDPNRTQLRYHAPLGAFAAYHVLDERGAASETCLAGFVAVGRHHGHIPTPERYIANWTSETRGNPEQLAALRKQAADIHEQAESLAADIFTEATGNSNAWRGFATALVNSETLFEDIHGQIAGREGIQTDPFSERFYGLVLELWGALVLADKTSAAGAPTNTELYEPTKPELDSLDDHVAEIEANVTADPTGSQAEQLNHYRSAAREDVLANASEFAAQDEEVATITLPTGMGKTLTGLSAALELRDTLDNDRVVYALPFTSIIDQVVDEAEDIFDTTGTDRVLATHHHLADTSVSQADGLDAEAADLSDDIAGMLGESWRAGLTVTTFVQLFESLAGPRNTQGMKLPALRNSVILLDEPQSLPLDWWKLVPRLVDLLTTQYDATVLSMTATQPKLFPEATELVSDPDEYFEVAERVHYHLHASLNQFVADRNADGSLDYQTAASTIADDAAADKSVLAVCNTIDSAQTLTDTVTTQLQPVDLAETYQSLLRDGHENPVEATVNSAQSRSGRPFVHLSTRLRPRDRLALIESIKSLREEGEPVVAVTTQLVEAGVDISFESVYRDLAPIDSLVQAAGRCNRSFTDDHGDVTVWWLAPPGDRDLTPAEGVYDRGGGPELTAVTAQTLAQVRTDTTRLSGATLAREGVTQYYERLADKNVGRDEWTAWVDDADGDALADLSLIDTPRSVDVIICLTDADHTLVTELDTAIRNYNFDTVAEKLSETKPLRVSVPIYDPESPEAQAVKQLQPLGGSQEYADLRVLKATDPQFDHHYDETTGFVVDDQGVERRFL